MIGTVGCMHENVFESEVFLLTNYTFYIFQKFLLNFFIVQQPRQLQKSQEQPFLAEILRNQHLIFDKPKSV